MRLACLFLLGLVLLGSCQKDSAGRVPQALLGQDWFNTFQPRDKAGYYTYKKPGTFAPGLGREGFRLDAGGAFVHYTSGPADEPVTRPGTWQLESPDTYRISLRDGQPSYLLSIRLVDKNTVLSKQE